MVAVERAQGADGLVESAGLEFALVLEVDEEIAHAAGVELGEFDLRVEAIDLMDPSVVGLASSLRETFELDKADVILIPRVRRECVMSFFSLPKQSDGSRRPFQVRESPRSGSVQQDVAPQSTTRSVV